MRDVSTIAVLITCHNRKKKTLDCLDRLFSCQISNNYKIQVFLVDDGSTDQTKEAVIKSYSNVIIIQGNGSLFWNQGMRLAWDSAYEKEDYDFYIWLNDDALLDKTALEEILWCYNEALTKNRKQAIICGAFRNSTFKNEFSYGGRTIKEALVIPNGNIQKCTYINGNTVLVPKEIFLTLGNLSNAYTHAMGDYDYGLRAIKSGFNCYSTRMYVGICPINVGISDWCNPSVPLKRRWELLYSPKGLNIKEYIFFRRKFYGIKWVIFSIKAYLKVINPSFYQIISKINFK